MYTADLMCSMMDFLVDNIFVKFKGCLCRRNELKWDGKL